MFLTTCYHCGSLPSSEKQPKFPEFLSLFDLEGLTVVRNRNGNYSYIKKKPFGVSDRVALTCNKDNPVARKLYESKGFVATGIEDEDEIEMVFTLE